MQPTFARFIAVGRAQASNAAAVGSPRPSVAQKPRHSRRTSQGAGGCLIAHAQESGGAALAVLKIGVAATSLLLIGCGASVESAAPSAPQVTVAHPLSTQVTEWDEYTGRFEAIDSVDVRARVSGYLVSIHFRDGAIVAPGDLLFVIDPRPYQAALDAARADVVRAQTRVELTSADAVRGTALFAIQGISQEEFDERVQARKEAEAQLVVALAAERTAALNVEFTHVRAPIGGRMSENLVSIGNLVSGGQADSSRLATIVSLDPIQFVFDVSEADYLKYSRLHASGKRTTSRTSRTPVRIRLLDESTFVHDGRMDFVDNRLDPATATMRGRALVPNPGAFLTPGQFGRIQLLGAGDFDALLVPDSAVLTDHARRFVWVVKADNTPEQRVVELGGLDRGLRIVRAGLGAGDRVVIGGMQRVRPLAAVTPKDGHIEASTVSQ